MELIHVIEEAGKSILYRVDGGWASWTLEKEPKSVVWVWESSVPEFPLAQERSVFSSIQVFNWLGEAYLHYEGQSV